MVLKHDFFCSVLEWIQVSHNVRVPPEAATASGGEPREIRPCLLRVREDHLAACLHVAEVTVCMVCVYVS